MAKHSQTVSRYLQHSDFFSSLYDTYREEAKLLQLIQQQFPRDLTSHCTAVHKKGQILTLYVDAPVWASKMRYMSGKIAESAAVREVKIRVSPPQPRQQPGDRVKKTRPRHSDKASKILSAAASCTADKDLKAVLQRLSKAIKQ
jgi:hypothetical protein